MATTPADPLLDRILYNCKLSAGRMPIAIVVRDDAERDRGLALLKGRHNNQAIGFITEAEIRDRIARQCRAWKRDAAWGRALV